jgi:adenylate kinase family enzyme
LTAGSIFVSDAGPVRRISVVGSSGSGKTTLASAVAERLGLVHVELDALYHGPGWSRPEPDAFRSNVAAALDAAADGWVACGNYSLVREEVVWRRADTVVILDLPKAVVMRRLIPRTLKRTLRREALWNGNRESLSNLLSWNPDRNVIRWAWMRHDLYSDRYGQAACDPANAHLDFVRLRCSTEVDAFLASLAI